MQVARDRFGFEAIQAAQIADSAFERLAGFDGIQVADVLAEEDLRSYGYGDCILQVCADRQNRPKNAVYPHRQRSVAARPPQHHLVPARDAHDRIVAGALDGTVVQQKGIRDAAEALLRLFVAGGDRLVTAVSAGRHQRKSALARQQVVQRRVGQHRSDVRRVFRHGGRKSLLARRFQQHDGGGRRKEQRFFGGRDTAEAFGRSYVRHQDGKRLLFAPFAAA
jgi:hypothetical protein